MAHTRRGWSSRIAGSNATRAVTFGESAQHATHVADLPHSISVARFVRFSAGQRVAPRPAVSDVSV